MLYRHIAVSSISVAVLLFGATATKAEGVKRWTPCSMLNDIRCWDYDNLPNGMIVNLFMTCQVYEGKWRWDQDFQGESQGRPACWGRAIERNCEEKATSETADRPEEFQLHEVHCFKPDVRFGAYLPGR
ncbi:hypothetical protein P389DRAFT_170022 [Cystobasidium minutum MCA 4210]|uniref:uncharacterized protein n=1 Tax=Cystobasidium minutum MCA 4210 TaxID=1397322 RepID=UPI0034CF2DD9|eukprot:jgi/Rhomi1/170022/fgenesh1_kg.3_\